MSASPPIIYYLDVFLKGMPKKTGETSKELTFSAIGGFDYIGASAALAKLDGISVLFDCGIFIGSSERAAPRELESVKPDVILLSHAHIDHIGALPIVVRNNPGVPVYATTATKTLAEIMLRDAGKLAEMNHRKIYDQEEINSAITSIIPVSFDDKVAFRDLTIHFRRAGHILGAATIIVEGGFRIVYTGDFSGVGTLLTQDPDLPKPPQRSDLLICEATYGGRRLKPRKDEETALVSSISGILKGGGRVLIPCFALGRAQEVLMILDQAIREGQIPHVPVYLDGMVREVTQAYSKLADGLADPEAAKKLNNWRVVNHVSSMEQRIDLLFGSEQCILLASSGMLTGGWSTWYAKDICSRKNSGILFVGYLDEESPGYRLREMSSGKVKLFDDEIAVNCKVESFALSAHADIHGIVRLARAYRPKIVAPVHGEPSARWKVAREVKRATNALVLMAYNGQQYQISKTRRKVKRLQTAPEALALKFLETTASQDSLDPVRIRTSFGKFLSSLQVRDQWEAERLFWNVYRYCSNFLSRSPWTTIRDRSKYYLGCLNAISEIFPSLSQTVRHDLERTMASFLANLVTYGGHRSWADAVEPVEVRTLEEAEALLVQVWKDFGISSVSVFELYRKCGIRTDWPANTEIQDNFESVFKPLKPFLEVEQYLPKRMRLLVVDGTMVGAVDGRVVLHLSSPCSPAESPRERIEKSLKKVRESKLLSAAGWSIDHNKVKLGMLIDGQGVYDETTGISEAFISWLSKVIQPFKAVVGSDTLFELSDMPGVLKRAGFQISMDPKFIAARRKSPTRKFLIAVDPDGSHFATYRSQTGCVMDPEQFKTTIRRLEKVWRNKINLADRSDRNKLATDVIVNFGWHAYLSEMERRKSLDSALDIYELDHLLNLLRMLDNFWAHSPSHSLYAPIARADRAWLEANYTLKRTPMLRNFARDVRRYCGLEFSKDEFDRYFVVIP